MALKLHVKAEKRKLIDLKNQVEKWVKSQETNKNNRSKSWSLPHHMDKYLEIYYK